jgi:hypothetical protein
MVAAVELYLDQPATRRIRLLWNALGEAGVPTLRDYLQGRHRPHVSLTGAPALDPAACAAALDGFEVAAPLRLSFQYTGVFVGRALFLGPSPTAELLAHHAAVWERLTAAGVPMSPLYAPGAWVPHCTLSMRVPRPVITEALRHCLEYLPIEATVVGAAVVDHARDQLTPLK